MIAIEELVTGSAPEVSKADSAMAMWGSWEELTEASDSIGWGCFGYYAYIHIACYDTFDMALACSWYWDKAMCLNFVHANFE